MKTVKKIVIVAIITAVLSVSGIAMAGELSWGSAAAAEDTSLTQNDMLTYAIQDEYTAQAEYNAIIGEFGNVRPFSNIVRAEGTHIAALKTLLNVYGFAVPVNNAAQRVSVPASLADAKTAGVNAEKANIAMYERFLKENLPADVRTVFENLMAASKNHLAAFENSSGNSGAAGPAQYGMQANNGTCTGDCTQTNSGSNLGNCTQSGAGMQYGRKAGFGSGNAGRNS